MDHDDLSWDEGFFDLYALDVTPAAAPLPKDCLKQYSPQQKTALRKIQMLSKDICTVQKSAERQRADAYVGELDERASLILHKNPNDLRYDDFAFRREAEAASEKKIEDITQTLYDHVTDLMATVSHARMIGLDNDPRVAYLARTLSLDAFL